MEIFLLLLDDLDDLFHALRVALPRFAGLLFALSVFAVTVFSAMRWPWLVASGALIAALGLAIHDVARGARAMRLKTDP